MTDGPLRPLTGKQESIAAGIARGLTYAELASEMDISESTVKGHVIAIMNVLPNPDHLDPYLRIFLWWHHRQWETLHVAHVLRDAS